MPRPAPFPHPPSRSLSPPPEHCTCTLRTFPLLADDLRRSVSPWPSAWSEHLVPRARTDRLLLAGQAVMLGVPSPHPLGLGAGALARGGSPTVAHVPWAWVLGSTAGWRHRMSTLKVPFRPVWGLSEHILRPLQPEPAGCRLPAAVRRLAAARPRPPWQRPNKHSREVAFQSRQTNNPMRLA